VREADIGRAAARSPSLRHFLQGVAGLLGEGQLDLLAETARSLDRDILTNLLGEVTRGDAIVWRTMDGTAFTASRLRTEIEEGTDIGLQYASDLLRVARDMLERAAGRSAA
jgi:hypothetical protein